MKKLITTVASLAIVVSMAFASGGSTTETRVSVVHPSEDVIKVFYTVKEESVVKIRLKDAEGNLLRTDRIKNVEGFVRPYNLANLQNGTYYVELEDKYGIVTEKVERNGIKSTQSLDVRPVSDHKYRLFVAEKKAMPLEVAIYDAQNRMLHREFYASSEGFTRVYDLSKFGNQRYRFVLTANNRTQSISVAAK